MYGSFPSFAQRDTVFGVTCRIAATSVAVIYPDRLAGPMRLHPFYMLAGHAAPERGCLNALAYHSCVGPPLVGRCGPN